MIIYTFYKLTSFRRTGPRFGNGGSFDHFEDEEAYDFGMRHLDEDQVSSGPLLEVEATKSL